MQVLFQTMVAKVHGKVVRLVAAPVHLFGLAGGSIPSASCGWVFSLVWGGQQFCFRCEDAA